MSKKLTRVQDILTKPSRQLVRMVATLIFLLTCLVYNPALKNDFVNWDDDRYVYENSKIQSLNSQTLHWMLTTFHEANWHPLTWLSHALDYTIWTLNPFGHHLTSVILHGLNTLLVFTLVIQLMSLATAKKSLLVASVTALLFGLHPLHVESVAWIAERKDLLCSFFVFLSILFYLAYTSSVVKRNRRVCFLTCLLFFTFALLSKPMAITLPLILLLLDIYPLNRLVLSSFSNASIFFEKIPLFILSIASSVITLIAQHSGGAIKSLEQLQLNTRLLNALRSLIFYLEKLILPVNLVPFYPFPKHIAWFDLPYLLSSLLVLVIIGFCWGMARQGKYLFPIAWSYYVVTLLPVLGIIQIGGQAAADRYTYLPSLSIFLLLGIGVLWILEKVALIKLKGMLGGLVLVLSCIFFLLAQLTTKQIKIWQNSEILWSYVISAFPKRVPVAHLNLSNAYAKKDLLDETITQCKRAIALKPRYAEAHNNLGSAYLKKGNLDKAIYEYKKAINSKPHYAKAHYNLGIVYFKNSRFDDAISEFKEAIALNPGQADAYHKLGSLLEIQGKLRDAISIYREAILYNPDYYKLYNNLAWIYATSPNRSIRDGDKAVASAIKACKLTGFKKAEVLDTLAAAYAELGNFSKAIEYQHRAIELASPQIKKQLQKHLQFYKLRRPYRD